MPNAVENYFEEGLGKFPEDTRSYEDLPKPEGKSPNPNEFRIEEGLSNITDEEIWPVTDIWISDEAKIRINGRESHRPPFYGESISEEDRDLIDGGIRHFGFDVMAFYKSRRDISSYPFRGRWGIFYFKQAVHRIAELIESEFPGYGAPHKLAYGFLRAHERYHYKFDLWSLAVEASTKRSLYKPLKLAFKNHSIHLVEEALANQDALEWARNKKIGITEFAKDFMRLQPGAYSRFEERKKSLAAELAANLIDLDLSKTANRLDQWPWVSNAPQELLRRSLCPEYFINPHALSSFINSAFIFPKVTRVFESKKFIKKLNPSLSGRWEKTKAILIKNPSSNGLNFKPWDLPEWSVKVSKGERAHLVPSQDSSSGIWEAIKIGDHKFMGHG